MLMLNYLQYQDCYIYSCHYLFSTLYMWIGRTYFLYLCIDVSLRKVIYLWNMQGSSCVWMTY